MQIKTKIWLMCVVFAIAGASCSRHNPQRDHAIYMLLDTSGTYTQELNQAQRIINYVLSTIKPGDTFAVARIDTGSFSEKDIVAGKTFDTRPSRANSERREFRQEIDQFISSVKPAPYTDISGGILQGIEYLNETGAGHKTIIIFSDMKEELPKGYVRDIPLQLDGFRVVAVNVTKLRSDNVNPREYMDRLDQWRERVESGGGAWKVINDMQRLEPLLSDEGTAS